MAVPDSAPWVAGGGGPFAVSLLLHRGNILVSSLFLATGPPAPATWPRGILRRSLGRGAPARDPRPGPPLRRTGRGAGPRPRRARRRDPGIPRPERRRQDHYAPLRLRTPAPARRDDSGGGLHARPGAAG